MAEMGKLVFGDLRKAWAGEAADFTPLLAKQLDSLGEQIGLDLASIGQSEVPIPGGRRIDIVASADDGSEIVVENQYGRADHDHLTRGLAYAVARRARGLVVVAEEHRGEFRAVAQYLNEMAERDAERGIAVWLVEARAVRVGNDGPWAPLFNAVVEPNEFTSEVEKSKKSEPSLEGVDGFVKAWNAGDSGPVEGLLGEWPQLGHRLRFGRDYVVLEAKGPSKGGFRSVVAVYTDGRVMVPFHSYAGVNSGLPIDALATAEFRSKAEALFGFAEGQSMARTGVGWLTAKTAPDLAQFCGQVADAYAQALSLPGGAQSESWKG